MPVLVAAIGVVVVAWIVAALSGWRRITWREHMDAPVSVLPRHVRRGDGWAEGPVMTRRREEVANPSLVLLRVRNSGLTTVREADIRRTITFTFPGRQVKEVTVSDCRGVTRETIGPVGTPEDGSIVDNRIYLPRFPLPRRAGFRLVVLLSGTDGGILGKGRLRRGSVVRESMRRGPMARNMAFGTVLAMLVAAQAGITFAQPPALPSTCSAGRLLLEGSTAFSPVARQLASADTHTCTDESISVSPIATFNGLDAVNSLSSPVAKASSTPNASSIGTRAASPTASSTRALAQIAMSDGPAPKGYPALVGHPVAVIIFAVVVSKDTGLYNLTVSQIRGIFDGTITNWRQVGGANLPVRIIARTPGSGTRANFDAKVLGHAESPFSSYNCLTKNAVPASPVIKCESADTGTLLSRVNSIPGAIGYAQVSDAAPFANVETVKLDGEDPSFGDVQDGSYPYWTDEYLYTNGVPASGSVSGQFLTFMRSATAGDILRSQGYTPCDDPNQSAVASLCR
jgi:ABC-type phosphate transport system substrate-binding protein